MAFCFSFGCNHRYGREKCSFFRFPKDHQKSKKWEMLCRRKDRGVVYDQDRICSCHFVDANKANGPSIFSWNEDKRFNFKDPTERKLPTKTKKTWVRQTKSVTGPTCVGVQCPERDTTRQEHSYSYSCPAGTCTERLNHGKQLEGEMRQLELEVERLKVSLQAATPFSMKNIMDDTSKVIFYTSLPPDTFTIIVDALRRFHLKYYYGWNVRSISLEDQLLMAFMKLRLNSKDIDLAVRFCTSRHTVNNVVKTMISALHELLYVGCVAHKIPSQRKCKGSMPKSFAEFGSARLVMDATEITQDIPTQLDKQARSYSNYKSRHTVKAVTCVAPNGVIVYSSDLYPGSSSDVAIVQDCGILNELESGDLILADKGFTLHRFLPTGVNLNIPPFLASKGQFTKEEAQLCTNIARARIHVERANERIKNFEILNHVPSKLRALSTKIFQTCCALVSLQAPLLAEISENYNVN